MIINICDRCGAQLPPLARGEFPQDGRIRVNGAELCGECAAKFEEFMQGAPVLKWNPVKVRPITEEELEGITESRREEAKGAGYIDGCLPLDGQEILITVKSNGWGYVSEDVCYFDGDTYELDSGECWEDVTAWAAKPEPYQGEGGAEE